MKILAIDTSTEACSAAIYADGDTIERFEIARQRHTELILPMIESLLAEAGLSGVNSFDALALGCGPGSFTGIRIGTGVAQGIALGADLPIAPVSSLAAIAQGAYRASQHTNVLAAIDARMQEIYWGVYQLDEHGYMKTAQAEIVAKPGDLPLPTRDHSWYGAGSAWAAYEAELLPVFSNSIAGHDGTCLPHSSDIAHLACDIIAKGGLVSAEQVQPVYLRNEVAWKKITK